mmetsp:Transcript_12966/g.36965  ORF Transcript_12966/g.36965 Transcript_12966/m.36965 type:complete len:273 (+) Transcript_12966:91-909(+)
MADATEEPSSKRRATVRSKDALGGQAKIAVLVPSTNTIVQPDFDDMRQALKLAGVTGVTNHVGRITIPNMDISTDEGFAKLQELIPLEVDAAAERCMSARCDHVAMGMSAPTFFGGRAACVEKRDKLSKMCGGVGISSGSFACEAALKAFGVQAIAVLSPYAQVGDVEVTRFFTEAGFKVVRFKGLRCPTPIAIAEVTEEELRAHMCKLDGPDVEALVQVGTNRSMVALCARLEVELRKPVLAINAATYWQAVRSLGIQEKIKGFGRVWEDL